MRQFLFILILILSLGIATRPKKATLFHKLAPPVESGFVVPYQKIFIYVNSTRWIYLAAQVWCESAFNANAVSPVGAKGLCQFMDATWKEWSPKGTSPFDPIQAIAAQNKYMNWILRLCSGNHDKSVASYNCGYGNVRKASRLADQLGLESKDAWLFVLPRITGKYAKETQDYVRRNKEKQDQIKQMLKAKEGIK